MRLRTRLLVYLVVLHAVFAVTAVAFLWHHRVWLLAVEAFFVVSFVLALRLTHAIFVPLEILRSGVQRLRDSDFTTRFRASGQHDLDELIGVYNQMADRLREERIRQQEQDAFLERVLAASPAGVIVLDFDGRVVSANPAARRMLGAADGGAAAENLGDRTLEESSSSFARALAELHDGEARVLPLQGSRRVKCQRAQFLDRGFQRPFLVLEELTDELRRSEKAAYDKLIRMMSHEVNNTTAAVGSLLSACLTYREQVQPADREDFTTALEVAIGRTRSLSAFMNGFADVVRLPPPRRQPADPGALVESTATLLREEALRRRIRIEVDIVAWRPPVLLDPVQMEQVLVNIVKNALEAIGEDGVVTLRVARVGPQLVLTVRDTGPGLRGETRNQLFAPFFTTKENGQGIGLTLVREILVAHRFEFSLDNAPEGGAEFVIRMGLDAAPG